VQSGVRRSLRVLAVHLIRQGDGDGIDLAALEDRDGVLKPAGVADAVTAESFLSFAGSWKMRGVRVLRCSACANVDRSAACTMWLRPTAA
jgi:hypothetical protein